MEQIPTVGVLLTSLLAVVVTGLGAGADVVIGAGAAVVIGVLTTEVFIVVGAAVVETTPLLKLLLLQAAGALPS